MVSKVKVLAQVWNTEAGRGEVLVMTVIHAPINVYSTTSLGQKHHCIRKTVRSYGCAVTLFLPSTHTFLTPLLPHTVVTQTQHQYTISTPKFIESYQLARATIYAALVRGYSKNFWVTVMLKWVERKTLKKPLVSRWYSVSIRWRWWRSWVWHTRVSSPLCATTNLEQTSHQPSHHNNQIFLVVEFCSEYWF